MGELNIKCSIFMLFWERNIVQLTGSQILICSQWVARINSTEALQWSLVACSTPSGTGRSHLVYPWLAPFPSPTLCPLTNGVDRGGQVRWVEDGISLPTLYFINTPGNSFKMLCSHIWPDSTEFRNDKSRQSFCYLPINTNQFPELALLETNCSNPRVYV